MPVPEEVDEINEYLKARRKKQELGELPRTDLTPSFVKKMSNALFGEKVKPKVPLQSMQPTYASPMAQSAVRKQLDEIMQERTTKPTQTSPPIRVATPASPRPLPPIPRYPESNVWASAAKPSISLPPKPTPVVRTPAPAPTPVAKTASSGAWGFWNKTPAPKTATPSPAASAPVRPSAPVSTPIIRTPSPTVSPPEGLSPARSSAFPSYSSIAATPPKPYPDIPPLASKGSTSPSSKVFNPISSVQANPAPTTSSMSPSTPVRSESTPVVSPARAAYAPPWVTRTVPKPGITPALPSKQKQINAINTAPQLEIAPPASMEKNQEMPFGKKTFAEEEKPAAFSSIQRGKPWVTGVLPKEAGEDFAPARTPVVSPPKMEEESPPIPRKENAPAPAAPVFSRTGSGEVRVDELARAARRTQPETTLPVSSSRDAALNEEISEEEAIDRLPFEEVEGLSESDLAYLERKEQEHAQTHDEELDQGDPAALRAHLEEQSQKINANPPVSTNEDPKKEILRRLKKMMEENPHQP